MTSINLTFGRVLRAKREGLKLSQTAFAGRVRWPQTTVSRVEQGRRGVTLPEFIAVAKVCGCSASDLFDELAVSGGGGFNVASAASAAAVAKGQAAGQQPGFSPGFSTAFANEDVMLAQLARYGVRFLGAEALPAFSTLPEEEVVLAALNFANEPRVFEALPALALKNADTLDWNKLVSGAYALRLQNRLGMVVSAALQLKSCTKGFDEAAWVALRAAYAALAEGKLDRVEVVGPRPKTPEALALLRSRTPGWLSFWHGLGSADLKSFQRYLPL